MNVLNELSEKICGHSATGLDALQGMRPDGMWKVQLFSICLAYASGFRVLQFVENLVTTFSFDMRSTHRRRQKSQESIQKSITKHSPKQKTRKHHNHKPPGQLERQLSPAERKLTKVLGNEGAARDFFSLEKDSMKLNDILAVEQQPRTNTEAGGQPILSVKDTDELDDPNKKFFI